MSHKIPKGFYVTAAERRDLGERVHEEIPDSVRYAPANWNQFKELLDKAERFKEGCEADAKYCLSEGWPEKAEQYREDWDNAEGILEILRQRWRECKRENTNA